MSAAFCLLLHRAHLRVRYVAPGCSLLYCLRCSEFVP